MAGRVRKRAPIALDLNGIAKGYGVDRLAETLVGFGIASAPRRHRWRDAREGTAPGWRAVDRRGRGARSGSVARRIPSSRSTMRLSRRRATTGTGSMSAAGGSRTPWTRRAADRSRRLPPRSRLLRRPAWSLTPGRPRSWCEEAWRGPNLRVDRISTPSSLTGKATSFAKRWLDGSSRPVQTPGARPDPGMHIR